ncbi:MAG TPA: alpha/beta hydrolase [Stellaceae bacterium]|nr:alpha/beta hydrolase [Stellaceae bacterium]
MCSLPAGLAALLCLFGATSAIADSPATVHDLTIAGSKQRLIYLTPPSPRATVIMFSGGGGRLDILDDGRPRYGGNFLVRTRTQWLAQGFAVVIPDALDGEPMLGQRSTVGYAKVIAALVAFAHAQNPAPIFLVGTSQGSTAAMNGGAHQPAGSIKGIVLTESVTQRNASDETVFDADPGKVTVPALIVANSNDGCSVAPPADASRIAGSLDHSAKVDILTVSGGTHKGDECGPFSPHGYYGIEAETIAPIAQWIDAHSR